MPRRQKPASHKPDEGKNTQLTSISSVALINSSDDEVGSDFRWQFIRSWRGNSNWRLGGKSNKVEIQPAKESGRTWARARKDTEGYDIEDGKKSVKIPVVQNYTSHAWARCFTAPSVNIEVTNLKYELRTLLSWINLCFIRLPQCRIFKRCGCSSRYWDACGCRPAGDFSK